METASYVVIGAGLAGASTAWGLAEAGARDIVILEQEGAAGYHSSGRSAEMIRQVVPNADIGALAREGAAFSRNPGPDWDEGVRFEPNGSLLLGQGVSMASLRRDLEDARAHGLAAEFWTPDRCIERVDALEGASFEGAVWNPFDGMIDSTALLQGFLREARKRGAVLHLRRRAESIVPRGGRVVEVRTNEGPIRAEAVVNAAGPWAGEVGRMAGAGSLGLAPFRRHLFSTGPLAWARRDWPFVWDVEHDVYFRPESSGLLLSACDESQRQPEDAAVDPAVDALLARKLEAHLPRLADVPIARCWAGLRTMAADHSFVIGWDAKVEGFFWVAGLGGHGVTTSPAVGRLAARMLLRPGERPHANPFDPARLG